jgi:hypothetical protein
MQLSHLFFNPNSNPVHIKAQIDTNAQVQTVTTTKKKKKKQATTIED